jgi:hypothetical protein
MRVVNAEINQFTGQEQLIQTSDVLNHVILINRLMCAA